MIIWNFICQAFWFVATIVSRALDGVIAGAVDGVLEALLCGF